MDLYEKATKLAARMQDIFKERYISAEDILKKATPAEIDFYFFKICVEKYT